MADLRLPRTAAWVWAGILLLLAAGLALAAVQGRLRINTDVLAMLPKDERRPEVEQALAALARSGEGRLILLLGGADEARTESAADQVVAALQNRLPEVQIRHRVDEGQQAAWLDFFVPQRGALLSAAQREQLQQQSSEVLAQQALRELMQPVAGLPRVGRWADDPLNTLGHWLAERAQSSRLRVQGGRLGLRDAAGNAWALVMVESTGSAFALAQNERLAGALAEVRAALPREVTLHAAGLPLHAHAAAAQAQREMHLIGAGSLVGVFVLSWLAFARLRPRLLVLLSVGSGLLVAVAATLLAFGELHLITLVFGASLVGVAENYASSYYSARIERAAADRFKVMREQLPTMALALATTLAGYLLLASTPFPGLQQVALFSAAGLLAAFVSTWLWFPHLDRGTVPERALTRAFARAWAVWPTPRRSVVLGLGLLLMLGLLRLQANDDIRLLQNTPPALMKDQIAISQRLDLPSPAQFYLLEAADEAGLLEREEGLKAALVPLRERGLIQGWQAVSDWVPSPTRQRTDAELLARRWAEISPLLSQALGQALPAPPSSHAAVLSVAAWQAEPLSEAARHQWLGADAKGRLHSVLMLRGVSPPARAELAALGSAQVLWVDKVSEVSELLARQRQRMLAVLALAVLAVWALLAIRFGRQAWRALLPTLLAGAGALSLQAWVGQPLQLFHVLALLLLLGVGVDYGIFLLAQPRRNDGRNFIAVTLAAITTWLSFGLLAFSSTPALQAFGWTLGLGVALAWALTPFFIPKEISHDR